MNTDATGPEDFTVEDLYAAIREIQASDYRRPKAVRLTATEVVLLRRDTLAGAPGYPLETPAASALRFFAVPIETADALLIAIAGREVE